MPASTVVNFRTVVHKTSNGISTAFPDVCLTPAAPSPIPIPYPNIAMSKDTQMGSKTLTVDGNPIMLQGSNFCPSMGDDAGTVGGVVSGTFKNKAEFIMYSFDVTVEGKNVCRLLDTMLHNKGGTFNTPPTPELQPPNVVMVPPVTEEDPPELKSLKTRDTGQEEPEE
jgi:hypothetical protein